MGESHHCKLHRWRLLRRTAAERVWYCVDCPQMIRASVNRSREVQARVRRVQPTLIEQLDEQTSA